MAQTTTPSIRPSTPEYTAVYQVIGALSVQPYPPRAENGVLSNTTLIIIIGKLEGFSNSPMHALCIVHYQQRVHATYAFLPKHPFLPVYSKVFLVCQVILTIFLCQWLRGAQLVVHVSVDVRSALGVFEGEECNGIVRFL